MLAKTEVEYHFRFFFLNNQKKTTAYTLENIAKFAILHLISPDFVLSLGLLC